MTQEEERVQLRAENRALREALEQTQELLRVALARIEELEKQKTPPPPFVKANTKKKDLTEKPPRKKRDAQFNRGRQKMQATEHVEHRIITCPDCDLRLGGISLARSREVIDVPAPAL